MKKIFTVILLYLLTVATVNINAQNGNTLRFTPNKELQNYLNNICDSLGLLMDFHVGDDGWEQISLAILDITDKKASIAHINGNNFIYPASFYKIYVAAVILGEIEKGKFSLWDSIICTGKNIVDKSKELPDPRPLISEGDTVTINYLLDLMITRSDNTSANFLIDIATRPEINRFITANGWNGSEVTRKFLKRKYEDPGYDTIRGTQTCAIHAVEFFYKVYTNGLISPWVSQQLMSFLGRQLDKTKSALGLPPNAMMYHKTGWWSYWTVDAGIVFSGKSKYIMAIFLPIEMEKAVPIIKTISSSVHDFMQRRHK